MALPDVSRLASLGCDAWAALADRVRAIGLTPPRALAFSAIGDQTRALPRQPILTWRLRRTRDPVHTVLRCFFFADPVTEEDAREALGSALESCLASGLVVATPRGLVSPFLMHFVNDLLLVCDDLALGGDAVMGAGETTADLANIAYPGKKVRSLLDLGCGAGTIALVYADRAANVVGTDINPRAITLARVNAALNRIDRVHFRTGDMYAPVEREELDLVVAQPPFIARHPGAGDTTFLFGGPRGDELVLRALRELPPRLAPGGRGVFLVCWPEFGDDTIEARVRAQVPDPSLGVTVLLGPEVNLDEWSTIYAAREHPSLGPEFDAAAVARREHLERTGIRALRMSATILERPVSGRGWTATQAITSISRLRGVHVDQTVAARALLARGRDAVLAARLRAADGATFSNDAAGQVRVTFEDSSPWAPIRISAASYTLVAALDEAPDARAAVEAVHAKTRAPREAITVAVEQALEHGVVEVS